MVLWSVLYSLCCSRVGTMPDQPRVICAVMMPLSSWSLAGEFDECSSDTMLAGVSGESLRGLIVGLGDSFPPLVSLMYMVSIIRVRRSLLDCNAQVWCRRGFPVQPLWWILSVVYMQC